MASARKTSTKAHSARGTKASAPGKVGTRKAATTKAASPKKGASAKPTKKKAVARAPSMASTRRTDFGAPIDAFFARQPAPLRPIVDALRALIEAAAPGATASIKWGMPVYEIGATMMCAVGAHKAHVNLILAGPPGSFDDPEGLLSGAGKTGRHLRLTRLEELPRSKVKEWLGKAARLARG